MIAERMKLLAGSQTSGMRNRARKLSAEGVHVVNFAAGELDQDTSDSIKAAARKAIDTRQTQYSDTMGMKSLREALARRVSQSTGAAYAIEEVGFTAGAKQALFNSVFVSFQAGDEVLIPAPYWVTFPEQVRLAGATPVFLPTTHHDFQIDATEMKALITPRTRGILLNTPHNPTGVVYPPSVLESIARLCLEHRLTCIFDECYDQLVYAPSVHANIVKLVPEMKARTILVGSLSKTYCIAGWRAGFVAAPAATLKAISNLQSHTASNACNIVQHAAADALEAKNDSFVEGIREHLRGQRALALERVGKLAPLTCVVPTGAFYLFPDVSGILGRSFRGERVENVERLSEMLLEHAHIAVVPGSAFGSERHVRISYAIPAKEIATGFTRLEDFIRNLS